MSSLLVLSLAGLAAAQGTLSTNAQVIATNGDPVPGLPEVFGGSSTFDSAVMQDDGRVLFRARFSSATTTTLNDRGYFYGDSRDKLVMVVRSGDPEPSGTIPGATLNSSTSAGPASSVRISPDGEMLWASRLYDGGVSIDFSNDSAIYMGVPGSFQILVREGDPAPGTTGAAISSSFSSLSQQNTGLNAAGQAFFKTNLAGGDVVGSTNDEALYTGTPGALSIVLRKGDIAPGGEVIADVMPGFVSQMNASSQILFDVSYVTGTGAPAVTDNDDRALWIFTPGIGNQEVVREGDPTPIPGVTFNNPTSTSWFVNTGATTFNAAGEALIRADLAGAVSIGLDDSAIVKVSLAGHAIVARRGDPAPGVATAAFDVFNNTSLQLNDAGQVAFQCTIGGPGVTSADDTAIFTGTPGSLVLVAREGDVAPGTGGGTFGSTTGQSMLMNGRGQLLFNNTLSGGSSPGTSLWSWDPELGLEAVLLSGDPIEVQPGVILNASSQGGVQFNNGDTRPLSFHHDGDFVARVNFPGGVGAIVRGHVGSLSAQPETISVTAGGTHQFHLNATAAEAGLTYVVAGSATGTVPGITSGGVTVPLNPDPYFFFTILNAGTGVFVNTLGTLDADGRAEAAIVVPPGLPATLVGVSLDHAWMGFNAFSKLVFASEAQPLLFLP